MQSTPTALPEVLLLQAQRHEDERGFLVERWNQRVLDAAVGRPVTFVQHNQSRSQRGVLRGLHWQVGALAQGKLVWAAAGAVFDVVVDVRHGSATFGRWVGTELSAANARQLWVPPGFAHGFFVLSECADVDYLLTHVHDAAAQRSLRWDDPALAIAWPTGGRAPLLSPRDAAAPLLAALEATGEA